MLCSAQILLLNIYNRQKPHSGDTRWAADKRGSDKKKQKTQKTKKNLPFGEIKTTEVRQFLYVTLCKVQSEATKTSVRL